MRAKVWLLFIVFPLLAVPAGAQESVRDLGGPGHYDKFLTPNQVDRWLFEGEKGETIIAHVASKQFDPILELTQTKAKEDKLLLEVDDPGNESRFSIRLPDKGKYEIRVHAYKYQGGGNYSLRVQRFQATSLAVGKPLLGKLDREGKGHHFFQGAKGQILIPELKLGGPPEAWKMLDWKGREMNEWAGGVRIEEAGEGHLIVVGQPDDHYELLLREARRQDLAEGRGLAGNLLQGEMDVWSFQGKPGDFRLLEVEKTGNVRSRLVYAPPEKISEQRLERPGDRPEIAILPVASRGGRLRFAVILGRDGRYQLQLAGATPASYKLTMTDPSVPIAWGKEVQGSLPVGGAAFYRFKATPGQLLQARLVSQKFVPVLRLFDGHGDVVGSSGDDADALEGRITHMVVNEGVYRLQVSSLGDGGGGDFVQTLTETKLMELHLDGRGVGTVQPGATDFWAFAGKQGQTVFLSVRSNSFDPAVSVRSPDGVLLSADNKGNAASGSLLALRLPKTGRYSVWISSHRGAGDYTARLIDGD
jgi:hypothetical protein